MIDKIIDKYDVMDKIFSLIKNYVQISKNRCVVENYISFKSPTQQKFILIKL